MHHKCDVKKFKRQDIIHTKRRVLWPRLVPFQHWLKLQGKVREETTNGSKSAVINVMAQHDTKIQKLKECKLGKIRDIDSSNRQLSSL